MSTGTSDAATKTTARKATTKKRAATSTQKRAPRKTAAKKIPQQDGRTVIAHSTLSLVALSPFRFPLDIERIALGTARLGGVAFVFLGLIFTYHYIESEVTNIVVENTQTAAVAHAVGSPLTPDVAFSYAPAGLNGEHIVVRVPGAEAVELHAYDAASGEYEKLGAATQTQVDTWEFIWDTIDVAPGQYWIKALVTNEYGMYDRSDSQYVTVE